MSGDVGVEASYLAGTWAALATADSWLLVDIPLNSPKVIPLFDLLRAGTAVDDLLDALAADGIRSAPDFALVRLASDERRLVVRGSGAVVVSSGGETTFHSALPGVAWADNLLGTFVGHLSLTCATASGDGTRLPLGLGVTAAAEVQLELGEAAAPTLRRVMQAEPDGPDTLLAQQPSEPPSTVSRDVPTPAVEVTLSASEPLPTKFDLNSETFPYTELTASTDLNDPLDLVDEAQPESELIHEDSPGGVPAENTYDSLFGATINPPDRKSWSPPPTPLAGDYLPSAPLVDVVPSFAPSNSPVSARNTQSDDTAVIASVPWLAEAADIVEPAVASRPAPSPSLPEPPTGPNSPAGEARAEQSNKTVSRAELLAADGPPLTGSGPQVLATYCSQRHLTAAHSAVCRVCGQSVPDQTPFSVARPPLGRLRLPDGEPVVLDRGVLFGREAQADVGAIERPHQIRLFSPNNQISRNHAEFVLDGWNVLVRDLDSTNGTEVILPGQEPVKLRAHDLFAVPPNSVIRLAEYLDITYEVLP